MPAIRFINNLNHEQILNLDKISSIEKTKINPALVVHFGKESIHINLNSVEERDEIFEKISVLFGCTE